MEFHYVDTAEIKVSIGMTTGHIKQMIDWMTDHHATLQEGSLDRMLLGNRIIDMKNIYEQAIYGIAKYAEGQKTNV